MSTCPICGMVKIMLKLFKNAFCSITLSKLAYLYVCLFVFSSEAAYTLCYSGLTQMKYDQGGRMEAISLCVSPKLWACVAQ